MHQLHDFSTVPPLMNDSLRHFFRDLPQKLQEEDKIKHILWSFGLMLGALLLLSMPQAFVLVFMVGLAKECWDAWYGSGFCLFDMAGNCVGISAGMVCGFVFQFFV